jgi:hypothetical protein
VRHRFLSHPFFICSQWVIKKQRSHFTKCAQLRTKIQIHKVFESLDLEKLESLGFEIIMISHFPDRQSTSALHASFGQDLWPEIVNNLLSLHQSSL